jgi:drug/metabolite transporter (DMT)-like permease
MDGFAFAAVLLSAVLHAGWNAGAKASGDKVAHFALMSLTYAGIGAALVPLYGALPGAAWPPLLAAAAGHVAYRALLAWGYTHGDLSFVYPLSRGSAPLVVAAVSAAAGTLEASPLALAGIALISAAVVGFGWQRGAHGWGAFALALAAGVAIALYSYFGGIAARTAGSALLSMAWLGIVDGLAFVAIALAWRPGAILAGARQVWRSALAGGAVSFAGYAIATWAMTQADIAVVTALRSTSVLFAVAIGAILMREGLGLRRLALAAVLVAGVVLAKA